MRDNMAYVFIWVAVDETTDYVGRFIVNILPGKLDTEVQSNPQSICSKVLGHANHSTVARFVNDGFKVLGFPLLRHVGCKLQLL
jgi:hypothetical protein